MRLSYVIILYVSFNVINAGSIGSKEDELRGSKEKLPNEELNYV